MLKQHVYDVIVATYHDNRFYVDTLLEAGVPYVYLKKAHNPLRRIFAVAHYIRRQRPDWVISYLETPSIVASLVHVFNHSFKLIVSERNTTQQIGRNEKIRFRLFEFADYVVANAYAQQSFIKTHFPKLKDKTTAIVNFVDITTFCPVEHSRRDIPEIVVAASIWPPKNTLNFIRAVRILKDRNKKFHVSWYGKVNAEIEYYQQCEQLIAELGVEDCISLLDKTKQIRTKYQDADCFVLPSFYEGTPNVICEAMACGLPIACSNVCDNGRYVIEGKNGTLFDPHSVESMADGISRLLDIDGDCYSIYRTNSRAIAEEKLSGEKFVESYIKLLNS